MSENAMKILHLQAEGFSTAQIAQSLRISQSTVKYHNPEADLTAADFINRSLLLSLLAFPCRVIEFPRPETAAV